MLERTVFVASALLSLCALGCGSSGPCRGAHCECADTNDCAFHCDVPGCTGTCDRLTRCDASCVDGCELSCADLSTCDLTCGDDCVLSCDRLSDCDVVCGERCDVLCADVGTCTVRMETGVASCARTGNCDIRCITPTGEVDATPCGAGVFGCLECGAP